MFNGICPKENVLARQEFELACYDIAIQYVNHLEKETKEFKIGKNHPPISEKKKHPPPKKKLKQNQKNKTKNSKKKNPKTQKIQQKQKRKQKLLEKRLIKILKLEDT